MGKNLVITRASGFNENTLVTAVMENNKAYELDIHDYTNKNILGNIYIGRVKNIVSNIGSAFIEIENGIICYYKIDENDKPIYTKKSSKLGLSIGDELLVQVEKEPTKSKQPVVSSVLNFNSKNVILTSGNTIIGVSTKLDEDNRIRLKEFSKKYKNNDYGLIIRTNAKDATYEELDKEVSDLEDKFIMLRDTAIYKKCFSCIYKAEPDYITRIRNLYNGEVEKIVTDIDYIYEEITEFINKERKDLEGIVEYYNFEMITLEKVYNISREIDFATKDKVWLKSGAYLVITPTEALTCIDVNSGKYISKKDAQKTFLEINKEAAEEIARQLHLRNVSGIIIIDFINMEKEEDEDELLTYLSILLKKDSIKTVVVDITKLGLIEVTRKRIKKSLKEQIKELSIDI